MFRVLYRFARLTKKDVKESSYDQLVEKMARIYGYQEFRNRSALSLLEAHHLYSIFNEKDRVLDVGTGEGGWGRLATKFTKSTIKDPLVICVDKDNTPTIEAAHCIKGDILDKQTRVEIVEKLGNNLLNTILIDVNLDDETMTGMVDQDAPILNNIILKTVEFGRNFVKPGGTVVCKSLLCQHTLEMEKNLKLYFSNVNRYSPAYTPKESPMRYFILKGFLMTDTYIAHSRFEQELMYSSNKQAVLNKFKRMKNKGQFNPQIAINSHIQTLVYDMLEQKKTEQEVLKELEPYAFLDIHKFIEKHKKMTSISTKTLKQKQIFLKKQINQDADLRNKPQGAEDMMDMLDQYIEFEKELREIPEEKPKDDLLHKDEQYMKFTRETQQLNMFYDQHDLTEEAFDPDDFSDKQIKKLNKLLPGFNDLMKKLSDKSLTDEDLMKFSENPEIQERVKEISKGFNVRPEKMSVDKIYEQEERMMEQEEKLRNIFQDEKTRFKGPEKHRRPRDRKRRPEGQQNPDKSRRRDQFDYF